MMEDLNDELDLMQFLTEDGMKLSEYYVRDLAEMNNELDPFVLGDAQTSEILSPLIKATTNLPFHNFHTDQFANSNINTTENQHINLVNGADNLVYSNGIDNSTSNNNPQVYQIDTSSLVISSPTQTTPPNMAPPLPNAFSSLPLASAIESISPFVTSTYTYPVDSTIPPPPKPVSTTVIQQRQLLQQQLQQQQEQQKQLQTQVQEQIHKHKRTDYDLTQSPLSSPLSSPSSDFSNDFEVVDEQNEKKSKKSKLSTEQKAQKRKQQTRTASKLYRQRKKALEVQLSERLAELEEEKRILMTEHAAANALLKNLKEENEKLKKEQVKVSEFTSKSRLDLLKKLETLYVSGADDHALTMTISQIQDCCKKCMTLGQCHLNQLLSPSIVEQLVASGFFEDKDKIEALSRKGGIAQLVEKVKAEIKSLTPEQIERMDQVTLAHKDRLNVIYAEREELTKQIVVVFKDLKNTKSDMNHYVETIRCLEHFRKSLDNEASEWSRSLHDMLAGTLTPRQMAQFLLRVEFTHASVCQLNVIWSALNKTWGQFNNTTILNVPCDSVNCGTKLGLYSGMMDSQQHHPHLQENECIPTLLPPAPQQ